MTSVTSSLHTLPWTLTPTDGLTTETSTIQSQTESIISSLLLQSASPLLQKPLHFAYLTRFLSAPLPSGYASLDASRPWLIYWILHSMALFGGELDPAGKKRVIETIRSCQNKEGGFGGGPGQISHLAPSYAAVCALAYVGKEGWAIIDRRGMYNFILSMKQSDGSFIMHSGGEVDVRGCYCALSVATLLNLLTPSLALNTSDFIVSCQTYEGGLAAASHPENDRATPLGETHGGYTFCAVASWVMLRSLASSASTSTSTSLEQKKGKGKELNVKSLLRWATSVQANPIEGGGFKGRTNKLVDGCYGWWCGGLFALISSLQPTSQPSLDLYDRVALQEYVLLVAQAPGGGLRDKPGKPADAYHTSCNLSGLSSAQSKMSFSHSTLALLSTAFVSPFMTPKIIEVEEDNDEETEMIQDDYETDVQAEERMKIVWSRTLGWRVEGELLLVGGEENELAPTHPVLNVTTKFATQMMCHFYKQAAPSTHLD